jgi:hypothetical protein
VTATGTTFTVVDRNSPPGRFRFYRVLPVVP